MGKIYNKFKNVINTILFIFLAIILVGSITNVSGLSFLSNVNKNYLIIINIILTIVLLIFINLISKKLLKDDKIGNIIKYVSFFIMLAIQVILIVNFDVRQMTDSYVVTDQASAIANNITNKIDYNFYHYFELYKNNNLYLLLTINLIKFFKFIKIINPITGIIIFNTIMIDLSIIISYCLAKKITNNKIANLVLIISCMNPLNYFMIFWTYTCSYSLPFIVGLIYLAVLMKDNDKKILQVVYGILFGFSLVVCYYLRPIILIPLVAIIICLIFNDESYKLKIKKYLLPVCCILISSIITFCCYNISINKITEKKDTYFPTTHWIMMGLHGDGVYSNSDYSFTHGYKTVKERKTANIKEIKNTLADYKVSGLIQHNVRKLLVTWSDGNSRYYDRLSQDMNDHNVLNNWLIGSKRDLSVIYCNIYRIVIILLSILYLIDVLKNDKKKKEYFLLNLTLFGAIVFYLIWEAKDIYSYPFLFLLIIFSSIKIDSIKINEKNIISKKNYIIICSVMLILLFGLKYNFTSKKDNVYSYYLKIQNENSNIGINNVISDNIKVEQEFYLSNKFNKIDLKAKKRNDTDLQYKITLFKNDEIIESYVKKSKDIKDGFITLDIDPKKTGKGKYLIQIESNEKEKKNDSITWVYVRSLSIDNYKGNLKIDNNSNNGDLYIRVYKKSYQRFTNSFVYYILFSLIIIILYIQYKLLYSSKNVVKNKTKNKRKK